MDRIYRFRLGIVIAVILAVSAIYTVRLFALQLIQEDDTPYGGASTATYEQTVSAARGEILDRHGTVLVSNRATYGVTLNRLALLNAEDTDGILLRLAETCLKNGIEYTDDLPLSYSNPFRYTTEEFSYTFKRFLLGRNWDADMTAENLAKRLRDVYRIPEEYTDFQARLVMGLRYELDLPAYANTATYVLTDDVSADQLAILKELSVPGMDVTTSTVREYNTAYAAHLLGYVRSVDPDQYENIYKELGYAMNAKVGQEGMEEGFESYLHGTDGIKVVTVASDGTILDEYWKVEPKSGSNVVTTIDIGFQEAAEKALAKRITELAERKQDQEKDGYDANAGALVVMDVQNGEVLVAANYPTYEPSEYFTKYDELLDQDVSPLRNRAILNAYPPGSTFKPITAVAAMRAGISPYSIIDGTGYYTFKDGTVLTCWITQEGRTHGPLDMRGALAQSCNIYFYNMGMMTGIDIIDETAWSFGIGKDSGSEISNNAGRMASPELKKQLYDLDELNSGWYDADTATAAIGQSDTAVTPLQLCRYISAMANGGTLYNATFLHRVVSSDFQTLVEGNDYIPAGTNLLTEAEYTVIKEGMRQCVEEGTGKGLADYPIEVCAKTGTASHGTGGSDHGVFVCWAPAENPEIAIAIYVEHGAAGSNFSNLAEDMLDYYFNSQYPAQEIEIENKMTED